MLDVQKLLRRLTEQNVDFVVIGGLAMITQGAATVTEDLDVCYRRDDRNLSALANAIGPLHPVLRGAPPGLPFRFDPPTIRAGLNITLTTDLGDVDLIGEVMGIGDYDRVRMVAESHSVFGITVMVLSIEGLIAAKQAAGRAKDQIHLLELQELKKLRGQQI
ncbi:MAG: hypothetical protein WD648_12470 [Planctomycetaceae bacterium]